MQIPIARKPLKAAASQPLSDRLLARLVQGL